jgi:hypothetical protein
MNMRASRKGLSPLLAIIIGLVVTVVAGILLAQLYFSYAATISARPAANVEYIDLVTDGTNSYLVINIKNIGNVPITAVKVSGVNCSITNVAPGGTASCTLNNTKINNLPNTAGDVWSGFVDITFSDGSTLSYAISARARSA